MGQTDVLRGGDNESNVGKSPYLLGRDRRRGDRRHRWVRHDGIRRDRRHQRVNGGGEQQLSSYRVDHREHPGGLGTGGGHHELASRCGVPGRRRRVPDGEHADVDRQLSEHGLRRTPGAGFDTDPNKHRHLVR